MNEKTEISTRVLDTHAVMAFLWDEPHAAAVEQIIDRGDAWMTLINLGEVAYIVERRDGREAANAAWANLIADDHANGKVIRFLDIDAKLIRRAATLKAGGGLSYADCFAAAAAERLDCPVMTGDPEFARVEELGIAVDWLR